MTSGDPLEIERVQLQWIGIGKSATQAVEEQPFAEFGKLQRFGQALGWRHAAQYLEVLRSVELRFELHRQNDSKLASDKQL